MYQELVMTRMVDLMGHARATEIFTVTMRDTSLQRIDTADDLLAFATALMRRGGVYEVMGGTFKIRALLDGAGRAARRRAAE